MKIAAGAVAFALALALAWWLGSHRGPGDVCMQGATLSTGDGRMQKCP